MVCSEFFIRIRVFPETVIQALTLWAHYSAASRRVTLRQKSGDKSPHSKYNHGMDKQLSLGSPIDELLDQLYSKNNAQTPELMSYFTRRAAEGSLDWNGFDEDANNSLSD